MPTEFASHFRLKDPTRTSFVLSPEADAELYVQDAGELDELSGYIMKEGRPVGMVGGDFGSGKSHLLRAATRRAGGACEVIWVELGAPTGRGFHAEGGLHGKIWSELTRGLPREVWRLEGRALEEGLRRAGLEHEPLLRAIRAALREPRLDGRRSQEEVIAWAYLSGSKTLTPARALAAGYSQTLAELLPPPDLARLYDWLAGLRYSATGKRQLLVLDEANTFTNLRDPMYLRAAGDLLRSLMDPDRQNLGVLWGAVLPRRSRVDHPAVRQDVMSRISRRWELKSMAEERRARSFVDALWRQLTQQPELRPFLMSEDTMGWLMSSLRDLRLQYPGQQSVSLAADPSRRDLLQALNLLAECAVERGAKLITAELAREWLPLEAA